MEDDETFEQTAELENAALDAMTTLVRDHGYTLTDLLNLAHTAVSNAG